MFQSSDRCPTIGMPGADSLEVLMNSSKPLAAIEIQPDLGPVLWCASEA
jgi:hypothetical protein